MVARDDDLEETGAGMALDRERCPDLRREPRDPFSLGKLREYVGGRPDVRRSRPDAGPGERSAVAQRRGPEPGAVDLRLAKGILDRLSRLETDRHRDGRLPRSSDLANNPCGASCFLALHYSDATEPHDRMRHGASPAAPSILAQRAAAVNCRRFSRNKDWTGASAGSGPA